MIVPTQSVLALTRIAVNVDTTGIETSSSPYEVVPVKEMSMPPYVPLEDSKHSPGVPR